MGVYKRGKTWYIDYYLPGGKRQREKAGTSKKLADQLFAKRQAEILEGKFDVIRPDKIPFSQLAKEFSEYSKAHAKFKSHEANENALKTLKPFFGDKLINMITFKDIEDYKVLRLETVKTSSVNRDLTVLKRMLNLAKEWGYLNNDIAGKVKKTKEPPGRIRYLSKKEIGDLLKACSLEYLKTIVLIALNTGMRKGEILNLSWNQIDMENGFIHLDITKSGERRDIPINQNLNKALENWKKICEEKEKAKMKEGGAEEESGEFQIDNRMLFNAKDIKRSFGTALTMAGISDFRFHDLRHTFASHLVMEGVDLATVSKLLGHSTINMTMRYAHLSPDHRIKAVQRIGDLINKSVENNSPDTNRTQDITKTLQ